MPLLRNQGQTKWTVMVRGSDSGGGKPGEGGSLFLHGLIHQDLDS